MGDFQQVLQVVPPSPVVVFPTYPRTVVVPPLPPVITYSTLSAPVAPTVAIDRTTSVIIPAVPQAGSAPLQTNATNLLSSFGLINPDLTMETKDIPYFIPYSYLDQIKPQDPLNVSTVNALAVNVSTLNANTVNASTINVVSTFAKNVLSDYIEATESYVYDNFTLDNQVLTANATSLLLNGNPLVTANQISSISDWAKDPAISTIQANGNDLTGVRAGFFSSIVANSMTVNKLTTLYSTTVETFESTITAEIQKLTVSSITGGNAYFDVITAGSIINPSASTINCQYLNVSSNATFSNATFSNAPTFNQGGTFNGTRPNFNTGINTSGPNNFNFTNIDNASNINGNVITIAPQNNLNINTSNAVSVVVDRGTDIGGSANINLTSQNGGGSFVNILAKTADSSALTPASAVNIEAQGNVYYGTNNPYGGAVNIKADAGLSGNILGTTGGGAINLTAYSYNTTQPGVIRESAGSISAYSGATSPLTGVYGYSYYSALNCLSLTAGSTTPSGSYPGVVYLRGDNGTKVVNGFYADTITATGNSVLPSITGVTSINGSAYPPTFSVPNALNVSSITTSTIQTPFASISSITDVSTINGVAYPPSGGASWVSTATTDLNMNGHNINLPSPGGGGTSGSIVKQYGTSGTLVVSDGTGVVLQSPANIIQTPTGNTIWTIGDTGATIYQPGGTTFQTPLTASTINAPLASLSSITNLSSINGVKYPFVTLGVSNFTASTITASNVTASNASLLSITNVSSINGSKYPLNAFGPITVSSVTSALSNVTPQTIGTNSGYTWSRVGSVSANYTCITNSSGNTAGYLAGTANGYIYYYNGGTEVQQATIQNWSGIANFNPNSQSLFTCVACVNGGGIYVTANLGTTWTLTSAPTANWTCITGVAGTGLTTTAYAGSTDQGIYYTTDTGTTWTQVPGSTGLNWSAIRSGLGTSNTYVFAVVNGGKAYSITTTGITIYSNCPTGAWVGITPFIVNSSFGDSVGFYVARIDGNFNYLTGDLINFASMGQKGYVATNYNASLVIVALPNNPIIYSINGQSYITSSSGSLPWSCMNTDWSTNVNPYGTNVSIATSPGYVYNMLNQGTNNFWGDFKIQAPNVIYLNAGNSQNTTTLGKGTIYMGAGTLNAPRAVTYINPVNYGTTRQPFIQYGTASAGTTSPYTVVMPVTYTDTTYVIQATHKDTAANTLFSANPLSPSTFSIAWTGAVGFQSVYWTTFGT